MRYAPAEECIICAGRGCSDGCFRVVFGSAATSGRHRAGVYCILGNHGGRDATAAGWFCFRDVEVGEGCGAVGVRSLYSDLSFCDGLFCHADLGVAFVAGLFALVYFFYPRILRRPLSRGLGYLHFWLTVAGMVLYYVLLEKMFDGLSAFVTWGPYSSFALLILGVAQLMFLINLVYSWVWGKKSI